MKSNALKVNLSKDNKKLQEPGFNTRLKKETKVQAKLDGFLRSVPLIFPNLPKKQKIKFEKNSYEPCLENENNKALAFKIKEHEELYAYNIKEEPKNLSIHTKEIENGFPILNITRNEAEEDSDGFQMTKNLKISPNSEPDHTPYKRKLSPDFVSVKKIKTQMPLGSNAESIIPQKKSPDKPANYSLIENSKIEPATDLLKDSEGFITNKKKKLIVEADENLESKDYNFSRKHFPKIEPEEEANSPKFKTLSNKEKKNLKGYDCERCKPFYEAFSDCMDPSALKDLCSEHKHQYPPTKTPEWYYKV
ncbi:unnamed protein product [Blepharisma stoltei]|uniref:DNA endonuclease RBBP8 n=1 Tax=Blepharisma stoltei TaxID=1481888 RepID=A0AAU9J8X4_9CILI|nr:unnamed protein product [Blepharisma stoltei]